MYKKHSLQQEVARREVTPRGDPMCKASIQFDDLWQHLASQTQTERKCEQISSGQSLLIYSEHLSELEGGI